MKLIRIVAVMMCVMLFSLGCSKKSEKATADKSKEVKVEQAIPLTKPQARSSVNKVVPQVNAAAGKVSEQPVPVSKKEPEPAGPNCQLRLCALLSGADGIKAGLLDQSNGESVYVMAGQSFSGYKIVSADYKGESVVISKDGKEFLLGLKGVEAVKEDVVMVTPERGAAGLQTVGGPQLFGRKSAKPIPEKIDLLSLPPPHYEQTETEKAKGIDPNDSKTWTEDYRGPGLERLLTEHSAKQSSGTAGGQVNLAVGGITSDGSGRNLALEAATKGGKSTPDAGGVDILNMPRQHFEPIPEETEKGIDPNNPATWTPDYLGPGIERAKRDQKLKEEAAKQSK